MLIPLSHPLTCRSPLYPGTPAPLVAIHRSMEQGSSTTTRLITLHTHSGTHLDLPGHSCPSGSPSLPVRGIAYFPCHVCQVPVGEGEALTSAHLAPVLGDMTVATALLIRTGAQKARVEDPDRYASHHAWVDPSVPPFLRNHLPRLRIFGMDAISIATPDRRDEGRACHRAFLCGTPPILLLEDMDLSDPRLPSHPWRLHLFPYLAEELDGMPVVAIAESVDETGGTITPGSRRRGRRRYESGPAANGPPGGKQ